MTELSGTLEAVRLATLVRFLAGLHKTGRLHVTSDDWHAEVFFDTGQVTGAIFGSRQGLSALEALVQVLPGGRFTFEGLANVPPPTISLDSDALLDHLDSLGDSPNGVRRLPSLDSVPVVARQDENASSEEPLALDRGTLQTLLAIDGLRTVRQIVAQRGTLDALWHVANLAGTGLVRVESRPSGVEPSADQADEPRAADSPLPRSNAAQSGSAPQAVPACPELGFEDDPQRSFDRPTRLHRCFAAGTPLPLSLDQQRDLCLSQEFDTCPRLSGARVSSAARADVTGPGPMSIQSLTHAARPERIAWAGSPRTVSPAAPGGSAGSAGSAPAPGSSASGRPVRSVGTPSSTRSIGSVGSSGSAGATGSSRSVGSTSSLGSAGTTRLPAREAGPRDTPFFSKSGQSGNGRGSDSFTNGASADPAASVAPSSSSSSAVAARSGPSAAVTRRMDDSAAVGRGPAAEAAVEERTSRRPVWLGLPAIVPIPAIVGGGAIGVVLLAVVGFLLVTQLGSLFGDPGLDTSSLPNTSEVLAGTPVAQVVSGRSTPQPVARPGDASGAEVSQTPDDAAGTAPSAASAANAPSKPTLSAPSSPDSVASQAAASERGVAAQSGGAGPAPKPGPAAQPGPPGALLDEHFTNNSHTWPSNPQGTALVSSGSYQLQPRQAGQFVAIGAPGLEPLGDVVVTATFHKLDGPPGGGYGILVRDQSPTPQNGTSQNGRYYVLEVGDKGEVGMWRRDGDHWVDLMPWQHADAVRTDNAANEVSVRAIGDRLDLSVNGALVATRTDGTFTSGGVGLFVGGDGNHVAVDRFSVQTP